MANDHPCKSPHDARSVTYTHATVPPPRTHKAQQQREQFDARNNAHISANKVLHTPFAVLNSPRAQIHAQIHAHTTNLKSLLTHKMCRRRKKSVMHSTRHPHLQTISRVLSFVVLNLPHTRIAILTPCKQYMPPWMPAHPKNCLCRSEQRGHILSRVGQPHTHSAVHRSCSNWTDKWPESLSYLRVTVLPQLQRAATKFFVQKDSVQSHCLQSLANTHTHCAVHRSCSK